MDRLRRLLLKRAAVPEAALSGLLSSHAAQIAPGHLSATVAKTVLSKACMPTPIYSLLQESIKQALWPKVTATASGVLALMVGAGALLHWLPKHHQQSSSDSFETRLVLRARPVAGSPPAMEPVVQPASTSPPPEEIQPVVSPAVVLVPPPKVGPVPVKPITNLPPKLAVLAPPMDETRQAPNASANKTGPSKIQVPRFSPGFRQPTGVPSVAPPAMTAPAAGKGVAQPPTPLQPPLGINSSAWMPAPTTAKPARRVKATPKADVKP